MSRQGEAAGERFCSGSCHAVRARSEQAPGSVHDRSPRLGAALLKARESSGCLQELSLGCFGLAEPCKYCML